jgi:hypothetical protein
VAFEVGGVAYAVDIQRVREITRAMPILPLPHLPPSVVGVVDHRGDVVPVVDLRHRFGVGHAGVGREVRWIVVMRGARLLALVVKPSVSPKPGSTLFWNNRITIAGASRDGSGFVNLVENASVVEMDFLRLLPSAKCLINR